MKKMIFALAVLFALPAHAQIDEVLRQIEQNNTTLRALADQAGADKLASRTGILLPDPEVEFARLWGTPATIGNRTDIAVSQRFDIATITGMKARQARRRNGLIDLGFASERTNILLEAKQLCIELIYYNRLATELQTRLEHARTIADGYERKLASGDANRLESGKARFAFQTVQGELARCEVERAVLLAELTRLNGGRQVAFDGVDFPPVVLPADFEGWYADAEQKSPVLEYVRREVEANHREVSLARVEGLPAFSVGYMRERTVGQRYEGVTVRVSIPLWANRNRVKQARAAHTAAQTREQDTRVQFYGQLHNQHARAAGLAAACADYRRAMSESTNAILLKKALDAGEISLLDYIIEMGLYYDTAARALEAERDFQLAYAALTAVEL